MMTSVPDTDTLTKIAAWLNVPVESLLKDETVKDNTSLELSTPDMIEVHLRADKELSPETAKALAESFRLLYNQFKKQN